jgi:hypothetical protein
MIFEYDGEDLRLVSQQRVDVVVTGYEFENAPREGVMAEVRTAEGDVLSRVPVPQAAERSVEVFPETPDERIVRVDAPTVSRAFTVVVPAPEAAAAVSVIRVGEPTANSVAPPPDQGGRALAPGTESVELGTFELER